MPEILGRPFLADGSRLIIHKASPYDYLPFEEHHYLTGHVLGTRCYLATHRGDPAAWCSTINGVGNGISRVHRLVVLPEVRGRGIGQLLVTWVAEHEIARFGRVAIRTRNAHFVGALLTAGQGWRPSLKQSYSTADELTGKGATRDAVSAVYAAETQRCQRCLVTFRSARRHSRYCSNACRQAAYRARWAHEGGDSEA
jgi:GNAT superfamily N-acetyltransferase